MEDLALGLAAIVVLGVTTQWLSLRFGIPMVLPLILVGIFAGPVAGIIEPDVLFGDTVFPAISLGVGILLFEGGLSLRFDRLGEGRRPVLRLVTVGAAITLVVGTVSSMLLFDLPRSQAVLIGTILIVSGPTVVLPLLDHLRLRPAIDAVARWEGIVIDPIGAALAVVFLELALGDQSGGLQAAGVIALTVSVGLIAGALGAALLVVALQRHLVPDNLTNAVTLMFVVLVFSAANFFRPEAGLFATTVLGIALANQRRVSLKPIHHFEESLGLLILAALFVVLGASIDLGLVREHVWPSLGLLAVLVIVARPLAVISSTLGTTLGWRERAFLIALMPRGIVAAAVAALFALELDREGSPLPVLVPAVYVVIFGTVILSSALSRPLSRWLRLAKPEPRGVAIVGGDDLGRQLAHELSSNDVAVLVIAGGDEEREATVGEGLLAFNGTLDTEELGEALDAVGVRQAIVLSPSEELTSYVVPRLAELLGRANVFYLPEREDPEQDQAQREATTVGRQPFAPDLDRETFAAHFDRSAGFATYEPDDIDGDVVPLIAVSDDGRAAVLDDRGARAAPRRSRLVALVSGRGAQPYQ